MNRNLLVSVFLVLVGLSGIIISPSIMPNMDQKIFIDQGDLKKLEGFYESFEKDSILLISTSEESKESKIIELLNAGIILPNWNAQKPNGSHILYQINATQQENIIEELSVIEKQLSENFSNWSIAGSAWTNYQLNIQNKTIQEKIFPLIFIFIGILFFLFLKNGKLAIFSFLISLSCTGYSFWLIKIIKNELHLLTNLIPLLNFIIPTSLTLHLIFSIRKYEKWEKFWENKKKPIMLTSLTTLTGFASLYFSAIQGIRDFALLSTISLTFNFLFTLCILYLCSNVIFLQVGKKVNYLKIPSLHLPKIINKNMTLLCLFSIGLGGYVLTTLPILVEAENFFPNSHIVRKGIDQAKKTLGGLPVAELIIYRDQEILYNELKYLDDITNSIAKDHPTLQIISPMHLIKLANKKYTDNEIIPDFELSARTLYSQIPKEIKNNSWQKKRLRITLVGEPNIETLNTVEQIKSQFTQKLDPAYKTELNGDYYYISKSQSHLVRSLLSSFGISFLFSTLIIIYYLRSYLEIKKFILVNLAPVALTILSFPILGMQINMATIMSFSVSFGLIVDGTIHLLFAKDHEKDSVNQPILLSSLCIIFSFLPLTFYGFVPIWQFAATFCLTIFLGLIFDLYFLKKI
jgi:predicted RND superfamily exporter protein